jgi:hypothetical protein
MSTFLDAGENRQQKNVGSLSDVATLRQVDSGGFANGSKLYSLNISVGVANHAKCFTLTRTVAHRTIDRDRLPWKVDCHGIMLRLRLLAW